MRFRSRNLRREAEKVLSEVWQRMSAQGNPATARNKAGDTVAAYRGGSTRRLVCPIGMFITTARYKPTIEGLPVLAVEVRDRIVPRVRALPGPFLADLQRAHDRLIDRTGARFVDGLRANLEALATAWSLRFDPEAKA